MRNSTRREFVAAALVGATTMVLGNPILAYADTTAETQAEADAVAAKLAEWQIQLNVASDNYYTALEEHDDAVAKMTEEQVRIDAADAKIAELQTHLGERASAMYREGPANYLSVLLGATSFTEFASDWDFLNDLNEADSEAVEETKAAKKEAEDARAEYAAQEQRAADKLAEAESIQAEASGLVAQYQAELDGLNDEVAALVAAEQETALANASLSFAQTESTKETVDFSGSGGGSTDTSTGGGNDSGSSGGDSGDTDTGGSSGGPDYGYDANTGNAIVDAAYSQLGVPYDWGGTSPGVGLDCSGLVQYCYACAGVYLPRTSQDQRNAGTHISIDDASPGDILGNSHHVAIYIGGGSFIEEPQTGMVCRIASDLGRFVDATRIG